MLAYPAPEQVMLDLGDKVVHGFAEIIEGARADLAEYRQVMPHAVARASARGLASWIHDSMWSRARGVFEDVTEVALHEAGPTRDIYVGLGYHLRIKRHSPRGAIRSYPTQAALKFIGQEPDLFTLLGVRTLNLCVGYEWDMSTRTMGSAVMTLRDGSFDDVVWMVDLPASGGVGTGTVAPVAPPQPSIGGPAAPRIELPNLEADTHNNSEGSDTP